MMKWIKIIISWLAKLIKNKKVQKTLFVGAGIGAGIAAGEGAVAYKRNKKAEKIKNRAIEKHDKARQAIDGTLDKLGKNKLEVCESFSDLADMIESIQQRPEFMLTVEGVDLPRFKPSEFKRLAAAVEIAVGGAGGVAAGGAVGAAVMGMNIAALGPGALAGSAVLCVMAAKMMGRAAERVEQAKQIEADVEKIIAFYGELEKAVEKYNDVFSDVRKPYEKQLKKMHKILARKNNWELFSQREKTIVENGVMLAQLLCRMCALNLTLEATKKDHIERVNSAEINLMIEDAKNVLKEVA